MEMILPTQEPVLSIGTRVLRPSNRYDALEITQRLTETRAVQGLTEKGYAQPTVQVIAKLPESKQATVLAGSYTVRALAENGEAKSVMDIIEAFKQPASKVEALTGDYAIWGLADYGQAARVVKMIQSLPEKYQEEVLAAPYAIRGLASNGFASETMTLIESVASSAKQKAILATDYARHFLIENGQTARVEALEEKLAGSEARTRVHPQPDRKFEAN